MALWNAVAQAIIVLLGVIVTLWPAKPKHRWWFLAAFGLLAVWSCVIEFLQQRESANLQRESDARTAERLSVRKMPSRTLA